MPKPLMRFKLFGQSSAQEKVGQLIVCTLYDSKKDIGLILEHNNEMFSSSTIRGIFPINLSVDISEMHFPDGFHATIKLYNARDEQIKDYTIDTDCSFTIKMAGETEDITITYDS